MKIYGQNETKGIKQTFYYLCEMRSIIDNKLASLY